MMLQTLRFIAANGVYALAVGVFIGILFPSLASAAKPLMTPAIGGLLMLSVARTDLSAVRDLGRQYKIVVAGILLVLLLSPLVIWALAGFTVPNAVWLAVVLMASAPPITSAPAMLSLIGLDADLSLVVLIIASMLAPFTIPAIAELIGLELTISSGALLLRLVVFVGVCTVLAMMVRGIVGVARLTSSSEWLNLIAVVLLLVFAIAIMDGVWDLAVARPTHVAMVVLIAFAANVGLLFVVTLTMAWCGLRQALTIGFLAANCNMGTLWAVLPSDTPQDVFLYFALAQIPMYFTPAILRFLWRRLSQVKTA